MSQRIEQLKKALANATTENEEYHLYMELKDLEAQVNE